MRLVYFLYISLVFFFSGCGNTNSSSVGSNIDEEPLFYQQWAINQNLDFYAIYDIDDSAHINLTRSILNTYTGKGIKIAVIDDGFDMDHPEFKDKIIASATINNRGQVISSDVTYTSLEGYDYHGTATTGIIASSINGNGLRGVAADVELILIKFYNAWPSDAAVIAAFNKAEEFGADIISNSWGTGSVSQSVRDHINDLAINGRDGKGTVIVFAAGNDPDVDIQNDESSIKNVIAVGATAKDNLRTSYSSYGTDLDIMAPGGDYLGITTCDSVGEAGLSPDEYNRFDQSYNGSNTSFIGTSAAAPILSGVLALALEKDSNLTASQLQALLKQSTDTIGLNTPYLDEMIVSNSQTPTLSGLLGSSGNDAFHIVLSNDINQTFGPYGIIPNSDNSFISYVTDTLVEANYTIELKFIEDNTTFATLENFEINTSKSTLTNTNSKKSDFYGYGKINVEKLLNRISF